MRDASRLPRYTILCNATSFNVNEDNYQNYKRLILEVCKQSLMGLRRLLR